MSRRALVLLAVVTSICAAPPASAAVDWGITLGSFITGGYSYLGNPYFTELLDGYTYPDGRHHGAIASIRVDFPQARIIVLTTFDGDEDIYRALQAGARGYLLKGMTGDELMDAIRSVYSGKSRIPAPVAERLAERMSAPSLTGRETEVLELIVGGNSNKEIAKSLKISDQTVKSWTITYIITGEVIDRDSQ